MLSLPWSVDYFILYYNKELFAKKGVALPEDLRRDGRGSPRSSTIAKAGIFGFVGRGLKNANMTLWTSFLLNYGGEFLDAKGNILTDGPEAIEATKMYQTLLDQVRAAGRRRLQLEGVAWPRSRRASAAMWLDGVGLAPPLEDPTKSRIVGKVGYGMVPAGPEGPVFGDLRRRHRHRGGQQEQGSRLSATANGRSRKRRARVCCRPAAACRSATRPQRRGVRKGVKLPKEWLAVGHRRRRRSAARPAGHRAGRRVPRPGRRRAHQDAHRAPIRRPS